MRSTEFAAKIGTTKNDIENWRSRSSVQLHTHYGETVAGSARQYSRENVIELALIAAFVSAGFKPSSAAAYAHAAVRNYANIAPVEWFVFSGGDLANGQAVSELADGYIQGVAADSPTKTVSAVHTGAVIRNVEQFYVDQ